MNEYITELETIFKQILLNRVQVFINKKLYKEGQFTLYNQTYFSLNLYIKNSKKNKLEIIKLPVPFDYYYTAKEQQLIFDYRLSTFAHNNKDIEHKILALPKTTLSRYFNNIIIIKVKP
jgi:hypothetical protein